VRTHSFQEDILIRFRIFQLFSVIHLDSVTALLPVNCHGFDISMKKIVYYLTGSGLHHRTPNFDICEPAHSPTEGCYSWTYINGLRPNRGWDSGRMYEALPVE
jgi:hypothetical protein